MSSIATSEQSICLNDSLAAKYFSTHLEFNIQLLRFVPDVHQILTSSFFVRGNHLHV